MILHPSLPLHLDVRVLLPDTSGQGFTQRQQVGVYRRCLHCQDGLVGLQWVSWWTAGEGFTNPRALLDEQLK